MLLFHYIVYGYLFLNNDRFNWIIISPSYFFLICTKLFLSSYIKNPVKYLHLQIKYFILKVSILSLFILLYSIQFKDLRLIAIIASSIIFIVCHLIEGFIIQKKLIRNVKKK